MKVSDAVWDMVNSRKPTEGFLATCDEEGRCDVSCFSSLQFADLETMTMLVGDNRTLENLKKNPHAAFAVASGYSMEDARGCRIYLRVREIIEEGPAVEKGRELISRVAGEKAGDGLKAFVSFDVVDTRPLIDMGQSV